MRNELAKRFGFSSVSIDEIMDRRGMWSLGHPTQKDWNTAYSEGYKQLKGLLGKGKTVILDLGNLKFKERETARQIAKSLGVESKLIFVNTPQDEILRRGLENAKTKERGHVPEKFLGKGLKMFEQPTPEENPILYNSEVNLEDWIRENINGSD